MHIAHIYRPYTKPSSFAPTDDSNQGRDAFFSTNPIQAQVNGDLANKVPLMIGFNKDEGLLETLPTGLPLDQGPLKKAFAPSSWEKCAPSFMIDAKYILLFDFRRHLEKKSKKLYFISEKAKVMLWKWRIRPRSFT